MTEFARELVEGVERAPRRARRADRRPRDRLATSTASPRSSGAILRVALYEILHRPDVPDEVAIDEAVETAKLYCGAEAPGFVNGILGGDAVVQRAARTSARSRTTAPSISRAAARLEAAPAGCATTSSTPTRRRASRASAPSSPRRRRWSWTGSPAATAPSDVPGPGGAAVSAAADRGPGSPAIAAADGVRPTRKTCARWSRTTSRRCGSPTSRRPRASTRRCATRCSPAASGSGPVLTLATARALGERARARCCRPPRRSS